MRRNSRLMTVVVTLLSFILIVMAAITLVPGRKVYADASGSYSVEDGLGYITISTSNLPEGTTSVTFTASFSSSVSVAYAGYVTSYSASGTTVYGEISGSDLSKSNHYIAINEGDSAGTPSISVSVNVPNTPTPSPAPTNTPVPTTAPTNTPRVTTAPVATTAPTSAPAADNPTEATATETTAEDELTPTETPTETPTPTETETPTPTPEEEEIPVTIEETEAAVEEAEATPTRAPLSPNAVTIVEEEQAPKKSFPWFIIWILLLIGVIAGRYFQLKKRNYGNKYIVDEFIPGGVVGTVLDAVVPSRKKTKSDDAPEVVNGFLKTSNTKSVRPEFSNTSKDSTAAAIEARRELAMAKASLEGQKGDSTSGVPNLKAPVKRPAKHSANPMVAHQATIEEEEAKAKLEEEQKASEEIKEDSKKDESKSDKKQKKK